MNLSTGELIAVKQVTLDEDSPSAAEALSEIENEINLMRKLRHRNIVRLLDTDREGNTLSILMEYVPGKSLDNLLQKYGSLSEPVIRNYTKQILLALAYCHSLNVVHRDIKGKNILVDKTGRLKLADFGSAKHFQNMDYVAPTSSYNYTPLWTAPEVLVGDYNNKVDVWSLGCVIIEMASARAPWSEQNFENPFRALYHIGNSGAIPKIPDGLSPLGVEFVKLCLQRDPDKRPSALELINHKWLEGIKVD
jgi:serine/threonine protein kinase